MSQRLYEVNITDLHPKDRSVEKRINELFPNLDIFDINMDLKKLPYLLCEGITESRKKKIEELFSDTTATLEFAETVISCTLCGRELVPDCVDSEKVYHENPLCKNCAEKQRRKAEESEAKERSKNRKALKKKLIISSALALFIALAAILPLIILISESALVTAIFALGGVFIFCYVANLFYPTATRFMTEGAFYKLKALFPDDLYSVSWYILLLPFVLISSLIDILISFLIAPFIFFVKLSVRIKRMRDGDGRDLTPFD